MIINKTLYSYNDLVIQPSAITYIESRSECNPFRDGRYLPLFTAPMSSVVDINNYLKFEECGIRSILPRTESLNKRLEHCQKYFAAFSLKEFKEFFIDKKREFEKAFVLIDVANGHMNIIRKLVLEAKKIYKKQLVVMIGNVANSQAFQYFAAIGVDYIRLSIGTGKACLTSANIGIHYGICNLIEECFLLRKKNNYKTQIIADGGIRNYSDVIKAIALGADYVMCGFVFAKMIESASPLCKIQGDMTKEEYNQFLEISNNDFESLKKYIKMHALKKDYYGMSTKYAQKLMGKINTHTSEGSRFLIDVDYTMQQWCENMKDYLCSAMSYCNAKTLDEFQGKVNLFPISRGVYDLINH